MDLKPTQAAALSVASNSTLVVLKLSAGLAMGSVSVLSEAIHSGLDLLAAIIALYSVTESKKPPDEKHSYGHGKIENFSALIEALLIFVAAIWIIYEAVKKLIHGVEVESLGLGILVMGVSAVANQLISSMLFKVAAKHDSQALEADGLHLRTDVYTSVGVLAGLGAIYLTGIKLLDPIIAMGVAALIIKASWDLTKRSFLPLLDVRMVAEEEEAFLGIIEAHRGQFVEFHKFRTRKAGPERHIDLHLVVRPDLPLPAAHALANSIEQAVRVKWNRVSVLIHMEPCQAASCDVCDLTCPQTGGAGAPTGEKSVP